MSNVIEIENLSKKFKKRNLLYDVNISIPLGKTVGIVGANGSGKSVLLKMISGLEKMDSGSIKVRGKKVGEEIDYPEKMGILINSPGFLENYSGFQNLKYLAGINDFITDKEIRVAMEMVGLNPEDGLKVKHYSVGMKQKLGIAQAIMEKQDILLLDEVFNGLDFKSTNEIKALLKQYKSKNYTMVLTSHIFMDLVELCDEIFIIDNCSIRILEEKEYSNFVFRMGEE